MLTQGFSQALQILRDTCLEANEVVLQPGLADSLHMYSLSLKLPMPFNKPKKQSKEDQSKKTEQNLFFFWRARNPLTIMCSILKNYKEEPIKESSHTKNEIWYSIHCRTSILTLQVHEK